MKWILYIAIVFGTVTCRDSTCLKSLGRPVKETREFGVFNAIHVSDKINLILHQDSIHRVRVETGENLVEYIKTELESDILHIYDENTCDFLRTYDHEVNVHVYLSNLKAIECSNTGNIISIDTFKTRHFKYDQWAASGTNELWLKCDTAFLKLHTGTGDLSVMGISSFTYIYNAGYGFVQANEFTSTNGSVRIENSGDVEMFVTNRVTADMNGPGNLTLYGSPNSVNQFGEGSGKITYK